MLVASYARWKEVIRKQLDPTKGMMQNKLKLTKGHMPTMVKYVTLEQGARRGHDARSDALPRRVRRAGERRARGRDAARGSASHGGSECDGVPNA